MIAVSGCNDAKPAARAPISATAAPGSATPTAAAAPATPDPTTRRVHSQVLGEDRTIQVYLPESYERSHRYRRYPVLVFRDGQKFFHSFTGVVDQLASDATPHIPEMIAVGIVETDRVRDSSATHSLKGFTGTEESGYASSGGGERFLRFLEQELIPYVDQNFSTSPYRIYCGYSFTGLSALAALLDEHSSFRAYIAIDPSWWWDDYATERAARAVLATRRFAQVQLFLASSGEIYPPRYFIAARDVQSLAHMLTDIHPAGLDWTAKRYADESHHSLPLLALYDGLSYLFRGYKPTLDELYNSPERLVLRYEQLSARLGDKVMLSEGLLDFFGHEFLDNFKELDKAARYFEINASYYPQSPGVWDSLGELYAVKHDPAAAARMYEKALALDPRDENAASKLQELRGK